jgi:hypothetical protein
MKRLLLAALGLALAAGAAAGLAALARDPIAPLDANQEAALHRAAVDRNISWQASHGMSLDAFRAFDALGFPAAVSNFTLETAYLALITAQLCTDGTFSDCTALTHRRDLAARAWLAKAQEALREPAPDHGVAWSRALNAALLGAEEAAAPLLAEAIGRTTAIRWPQEPSAWREVRNLLRDHWAARGWLSPLAKGFLAFPVSSTREAALPELTRSEQFYLWALAERRGSWNDSAWYLMRAIEADCTNWRVFRLRMAQASSAPLERAFVNCYRKVRGGAAGELSARALQILDAALASPPAEREPRPPGTPTESILYAPPPAPRRAAALAARLDEYRYGRAHDRTRALVRARNDVDSQDLARRLAAWLFLCEERVVTAETLLEEAGGHLDRYFDAEMPVAGIDTAGAWAWSSSPDFTAVAAVLARQPAGELAAASRRPSLGANVRWLLFYATLGAGGSLAAFLDGQPAVITAAAHLARLRSEPAAAAAFAAWWSANPTAASALKPFVRGVGGLWPADARARLAFTGALAPVSAPPAQPPTPQSDWFCRISPACNPGAPPDLERLTPADVTQVAGQNPLAPPPALAFALADAGCERPALRAALLSAYPRLRHEWLVCERSVGPVARFAADVAVGLDRRGWYPAPATSAPGFLDAVVLAARCIESRGDTARYFELFGDAAGPRLPQPERDRLGAILTAWRGGERPWLSAQWLRRGLTAAEKSILVYAVERQVLATHELPAFWRTCARDPRPACRGAADLWMAPDAATLGTPPPAIAALRQVFHAPARGDQLVAERAFGFHVLNGDPPTSHVHNPWLAAQDEERAFAERAEAMPRAALIKALNRRYGEQPAPFLNDAVMAAEYLRTPDWSQRHFTYLLGRDLPPAALVAALAGRLDMGALMLRYRSVDFQNKEPGAVRAVGCRGVARSGLPVTIHYPDGTTATGLTAADGIFTVARSKYAEYAAAVSADGRTLGRRGVIPGTVTVNTCQGEAQ